MLISSISYLIVLFMTIAVEITVARILGFRKKFELAAVIFINLITNPLLNYILFINRNFKLIIVDFHEIFILEAIVIIVEWLLLIFSLRKSRAEMLILSVLLNLCSFLTGIIMFGSNFG